MSKSTHKELIQKHVWPNGFRCIYEKSMNPSSQITYIQLFCDMGSAYEIDGIRGASHMIEHMCFKGTNTIPNKTELMLHFDRNGVYFNAMTEKRYTSYILKCPDEHVESCLRILATMILDSNFNRKEFKKEERVVIQENIIRSDNPFIFTKSVIDSTLYEGSSYMYEIDTSRYHTKPFNYDEIVNLYHMFYHPSRMLISVVSNRSFTNITQILKNTRFVSNIPVHPIPQKFSINHHIKPYNELRIKLENKPNMNSIHLCVVFNTKTIDKYVLNMLSDIISNSFTSKLDVLLRDKHGLTYMSNVLVNYTELHGIFCICVMTDSKTILQNQKKSKPGVFPVIIHFLHDICKNGITSAELRLQKGRMKGNLAIQHENPENITQYNGYQSLVFPDRELTPTTKFYETHYQHICKADVDRAIRTYFTRSNMTVCMVGNGLPTERKITEICEYIS